MPFPHLYHLGPDVLSRVFDLTEIATQHKQDLGSLCLISKSLQPFAQVVLYRRLYFGWTPPMVAILDDHHNVQLACLVRTLRSNSSLASLVRSLSFATPVDATQNHDFQNMCYVLAVCRPQAIFLQLDPALYPHILTVATLTGITRLSLQGPRIGEGDSFGHECLVDMVAAASRTLEVLDLRLEDFDGTSTRPFLSNNPVLPLHLPRLRKISAICAMEHAHLQLISAYMAATAVAGGKVDSLSLTFGGNGFRTVEGLVIFFERWGPMLRTLYISMPAGGPEAISLNLGKLCPSLTKLSLDRTTYTLASSLPSSLRHLHLEDMTTRSNGLLYSVYPEQLLQRFRTVLEGCETLTGFRYLVVEEDDLYPESVIGCLREVCERKGWIAELPLAHQATARTSPFAAFGRLVGTLVGRAA